MAFDIHSALGPHTDMLRLHAKRAEMIANNLANQDTPNFKAQDIDFKEALSSILESNNSRNSPSTTKVNAQGLSGSLSFDQVKYRTSFQPSLDGNTVDAQIEQAAYAENALGYLANLQFINQKFRDLYTVVKGS